MINNRQNGRRRGRGGGPRTPNNAPSPGNRQDNRSRGNASQLHEKYKALARDTQLAGDRVQTEYYLQFADHYFRVLYESRARFEEPRPRRDDYQSDEDDDQDEAMAGSDDGDQDEQEESDRDERPRAERQSRQRFEREPRPAEGRSGEGRSSEGRSVEGRTTEDRPSSEGRSSESRPRRARVANDRDDNRDDASRSQKIGNGSNDDDGEARISLESLPPAISVSDDDAPRAPRRRTRRPRNEGEAEIAPAA